MSTPQESAIQRTYPLSPSSNSELRKSQPLSFGAPRTPQSPLRGGAHPAESLPTSQPHTSSEMNSTTQRTSITDGTTTTSPMATGIDGRNDDSTLKRKHSVEETSEHKDKKPHVEKRKLSISDLHIDVGKIYQLCRTRKYPCFSNPAAPCTRTCMNYGSLFG